eukprot:COSAG01_NODE_6905_length_3444_cov_19.912108_2_plen_78_part_00
MEDGETPGQAYEDDDEEEEEDQYDEEEEEDQYDEEEEEDQYDEEYGNVAPDGSTLHAGWGASSTAPPYALPPSPPGR